MAPEKAYPMIEVARHTTSSSCWMVIDDNVYDVTPFLLEHPGGDDILLDSSGRDATREFEDVGHSSEARAQLEELCIGSLREATEEELAQVEDTVKPPPPPSVMTNVMKWLFPVLLLGLAVIIRKYVN